MLLKSSFFIIRGINNYSKFIRNFTIPIVKVVLNSDIKAEKMRVVYEESGKKENKIMSKKDAINFARSKSMDLILVTEKSDPVVCKIEKYIDPSKVKKIVEKKKDQPKPIKSILIRGLIEKNDLEFKVKKIFEFLNDGHQVKVEVFPKKGDMLRAPLACEQTTLKLLDYFESHTGTIQKLASNYSSKTDLLISPPKSNPASGKSPSSKGASSGGSTSSKEDTSKATAKAPPISSSNVTSSKSPSV